MHYHPKQTENFRIISGSLAVRIYGKIIVIKQGQTLKIPANVSHAMWNNSDDKTIVNWRVTPALQTEYLMERLTCLANDNRTNSRGVPSFFQKILMAAKYRDSIRLTNPPFFIQRLLFVLLIPLAIAFGYDAHDENVLQDLKK
jgi:hypothetical protein